MPLIFRLIAALGLIVTFTENPGLDCKSHGAGGCYWFSQKKIVLNLRSGYDLNKTLYHEIGHAIDNQETIELGNECFDSWEFLGFGVLFLREIRADYFEEYITGGKHYFGECPGLDKYYDRLDKNTL